MNTILASTAAVLLALPPSPAFSQYSAAEVGALAYCAARSAGQSVQDSDRAAVRAVYNQIGLIEFIRQKSDLKVQIEYLIGQRCPG